MDTRSLHNMMQCNQQNLSYCDIVLRIGDQVLMYPFYLQPSVDKLYSETSNTPHINITYTQHHI